MVGKEGVMSVIAIYENGILRPLTPLVLPERARVKVLIQQVLANGDAAAHRQHVREVLAEAGLGLQGPPVSPKSSISAERREELAQRFAAERPISELIVEEREHR
jgi:predicted DNA-binding antitoxin AbrB/MazE fold protein